MFKNCFQLALKNTKNNCARFILTIILCAVLNVIAFSSLIFIIHTDSNYKGLKESKFENYGAIYYNVENSNLTRSTYKDLVNVAKNNLSDIIDTSQLNEYAYINLSLDNESLKQNFTIKAITNTIDYEIIQGKDIKRGTNEVLVSEDLLNDAEGYVDVSIGKTFQLSYSHDYKVNLKVVGVVKGKQSFIDFDYLKSLDYFSFPTLKLKDNNISYEEFSKIDMTQLINKYSKDKNYTAISNFSKNNLNETKNLQSIKWLNIFFMVILILITSFIVATSLNYSKKENKPLFTENKIRNNSKELALIFSLQATFIVLMFNLLALIITCLMCDIIFINVSNHMIEILNYKMKTKYISKWSIFAKLFATSLINFPIVIGIVIYNTLYKRTYELVDRGDYNE